MGTGRVRPAGQNAYKDLSNVQRLIRLPPRPHQRRPADHEEAPRRFE